MPQDPSPRGPLLDARELADELGVTVETLARWRSQGTGPRFVRLARKHGPVRYRRADVAKWIETRTHGLL